MAAVIAVVAVEMLQKPLRLFIVMLVYNWHLQRVGNLPALVVIASAGRRPDCADNGNLRMLRLHGFKDHLEAFLKAGRNMIFIPDAKVFEMERLGMASFGAPGSPFRSGWTICPFNQI